MLCDCIACRHVSLTRSYQTPTQKGVFGALFFIKGGVFFFGVVKFIRTSQLTYLKIEMGILR